MVGLSESLIGGGVCSRSPVSRLAAAGAALSGPSDSPGFLPSSAIPHPNPANQNGSSASGGWSQLQPETSEEASIYPVKAGSVAKRGARESTGGDMSGVLARRQPNRCLDMPPVAAENDSKFHESSPFFSALIPRNPHLLTPAGEASMKRTLHLSLMVLASSLIISAQTVPTNEPRSAIQSAHSNLPLS